VKKIIVGLTCILIFTNLLSFAQGVDSLFMQARQFAFNGERVKAREICDEILKQSPTYTDVRILKGRTFSWDGEVENAKAEFNKVLAYDSTNVDAWSSISDVEYWNDHAPQSLAAAEGGIRFNPGNRELLLKRARALVDLKRYDDARAQIKEIKLIDSVCTACKPMLDRIYREQAVNYISTGYQIDYFNEVFAPFHAEFLQVGTKLKGSTFIVRLNFNQRFDTTGFQPEVDYYPSIGKKMYLYVNYGFSNTALFPNHRVGLELYRSMKHGFELSVGGRYMNFTGSEVFIYTGSVTKYLGNYAFIVRPFITPSPETKSFSRSAIFNVRKYTTDENNYVGLVGGLGFSPDQRAFLTNFGLDSNGKNNIYYLQSYRVGLAYSKTFQFKHVILLEFDYRRQELEGYNAGSYVNVYIGSVTYKYRF
jgi:YaiO family outer membrane protein